MRSSLNEVERTVVACFVLLALSPVLLLCALPAVLFRVSIGVLKALGDWADPS